jgi:arylamine N-acetyltransferase
LKPCDFETSRYLRLLGFERAPAGLEGLRQLVRRHLIRIPFENLSKLLLFGREGRGRITTLTEYLDGIEERDLGGTCYTANPFLAGLLRETGYDAGLLGCDMRAPNVHTAIRVRLAGDEYHVDVGYGGPFYEPLLLASLPHEIRHGDCRYVFHRGGDHRLVLEMYEGGEQVHGYAVNETPRAPEFFAGTVLASFRPDATFMTRLRVVRYFDGHSVELRNTLLIRNEEGHSRRVQLGTMEQMREAFDQQLLMPRSPVEEAVRVLEQVTGQDFFVMGARDPF